MRVLWVSDSPTTPSGFGMVTREVCGRLAARGHSLEILGWQGHGTTSHWRSIPVRPVRHDTFGADVLLGYLLRFRPDFVITLGDVWWMSFLTDPAVQRYLDAAGARWVLYYPVDGADPDGRLPQGWIDVLARTDVPIAMSRFGAEVSAACGIDATYIPHGCDLDVFAPPPDKQAAKAWAGYDGRFVVLSDARNQPRKLLPRTLDVFRAFAADKPDAVLHLHCDPDDDAARSDLYRYRIAEDLRALGMAEQVRFTPSFRMRASGGLEPAVLAAYYAAADAHLLSSWGEGFGLPNLQAAASGVVPLAVGYAAGRELVDHHGYALPTESVVVDEFGLARHLLDRDAAVAALDELYHDPELLAARSAASRAFASHYGWDELVDRWEDVLAAAPPRRQPERSAWFEWAGRGATKTSDLPAPVTDAMQDAFAELPDGTRVSVRMTQLQHGEVAERIRRDAFTVGDELSIPVKLPPFFDGAPRPRVGNVLVGPGDLPLAAGLRRVFPGLALSVPRPGGDPSIVQPLPLEHLLAPLAFHALVLDVTRTAGPDVDVACAALGIPYLGPSVLWPAPPGDDPFRQARVLLTDHGLSEHRRRTALARLEELAGAETIAELRRFAVQTLALATAGQAGAQQRQEAPETEMFLIRPVDSASDETRERIAERVALLRGLVLMATHGGLLIVTLPPGGKDQFEADPDVAFIGGISLDGDNKAARALRRRFATNAALQLTSRDAPPLIAAGR